MVTKDPETRAQQHRQTLPGRLRHVSTLDNPCRCQARSGLLGSDRPPGSFPAPVSPSARFFRISKRTTPWAATLRSPLLVGAGMVAASPAAARIGVLPTANARGRPAEDPEKSSPPAPLRAHPKLGAVGPALSNAQPFSAWDLLQPEVSCCRPADSLWSFASALCLHYIGVADERSSWPSTHRAPGTGKLFQPAQPVPVVVLRTGPGAGSGGTTPAAHPVPSESRRAGTQFQRQPGPGLPRQP